MTEVCYSESFVQIDTVIPEIWNKLSGIYSGVILELIQILNSCWRSFQDDIWRSFQDVRGALLDADGRL